jgi:RHS repeat-associated protein
VTERFYDPYGNSVGTAPASWPGDKGFQDGSTDTATGLVDLGAREYDPGTASFVSPDPLLAPDDPQDLNPYAYASDTPPTGEDPSGAMMLCDGMGVCGSRQSFEPGGSAYSPQVAGSSFNPRYTVQYEDAGSAAAQEQVLGWYDASYNTQTWAAKVPVVHLPPPHPVNPNLVMAGMAPQESCGFSWHCFVSSVKHGWDDFTSSQLGGCLWSSIQSDCAPYYGMAALGLLTDGVGDAAEEAVRGAGADGSTLPGSVGKVQGLPEKLENPIAESAETTENINDLSETGGHTVDSILDYIDRGPEATGTMTGSPAGPVIAPAATVGTGFSFEQAAVVSALTARALYLAAARAFGGG